MKIFQKLFQKKTPIKSPEQLRSITTLIGPGVNRLAMEIFASYWGELIKKPISYIVPAVWGIIEGGELDHTQKEINTTIAPVIKEILEALQVRDMTGEQNFAIRYLVNGYIISKIIYMIDLLRSQTGREIITNRQYNDALECFGPVGHA
jgi:hypothetical protein